MNAANDNAARKGLRGWWASPPRPGMQRLINPWEYRHLRAFGVTRIAGGFVAATAGVVCLSYAAYGWAAFFLVLGVLNLAGATGTSLSLAPHLPEPEPARGNIAAICPPE
jgi:hypothetical protein